MKQCDWIGHQWKVYRRDILTTNEGSKEILFFRCKICGFTFNTADDEENELVEKDFVGSENYDREIKM